MAIIKDKSIPIIKDKLYLRYDQLNIWFQLIKTRESKSARSKSGVVTEAEDLGYYQNITDACYYTLKEYEKSRTLTAKMKSLIEKFYQEINSQIEGTTINIMDSYTKDDKMYKECICKYLDKKLKGKESAYELSLTEDLNITFQRDYVYFSARFKTNTDNANTKNEYTWVAMGYVPKMSQAYLRLHTKLMLKFINQSKVKDIDKFAKAVVKQDKEIAKLITDVDKIIRKEIKMK